MSSPNFLVVAENLSAEVLERLLGEAERFSKTAGSSDEACKWRDIASRLREKIFMAKAISEGAAE